MDLDLMLPYIESILYKLSPCLAVHRNQWYDARGFGKDVNWEYGPWHMTLEEHALHDGILHPNSKDHRVLLFPSGNLGWIQMYLKPNDPRSVIFSEPMFYVSKEHKRPST